MPLRSLVGDLSYLAPWEFSPTVVLLSGLTAMLYVRGLWARRARGEQRGYWRPFAFLLGLALTYGVLQTYYDYLSQHMFWIHRLQHLVLHHIGPFLMIVAYPSEVLWAGVPSGCRPPLTRLQQRSWLQWPVRVLQNPWLAGSLFVGLVYFWLIPVIHFTAMLDAERYRLMNWGMAADGLLFWWLMLTPRGGQGSAAIGYAPRLVILVVTGFLQLFLGAYIVMHKTVLFDVYGICGRAWAVSPLVDQQLGGCLTWIPPAMMSLLGVLVVIHHMLGDAESSTRRSKRPLAAAVLVRAAP